MMKKKADQEYQGKVYELPEMMETLLTLTEEQWGLYAFSREPLRGKIDESERIRLALEASECGKQEARRVNRERGKMSVEAYMEKQGLEIVRTPKANDGGFVIFAQFKPPKKVSVFTDCLVQAGKLIRRYGQVPFVDTAEIEDLLLAHELFHHVENQRGKELFSQSYRLTLWSIFKYHYTSQVSCLSEIAGMAFAAEICGAKYSPYLLDVFLVYGYNREAASNLYEGILRVTGAAVEKEEDKL